MKVAALIVCLFASLAPAQTFDARVDELQKLNLSQRDKLVAAQTELAAGKVAVAAARQENIDQNAAFKGEISTRDKKIREQAKTLDRWYVKLAIGIAKWIFWITIGTVALYGFTTVGLIFGTTSPIFQLAWKLVSALPLAGICESIAELFHKIMPVGKQEVPIVHPPAVVAKSATPANSVVADRLAAMPLDDGATVVSAPPAPQQSVIGQAFYGSRSVGEILTGVGRR